MHNRQRLVRELTILIYVAAQSFLCDGAAAVADDRVTEPLSGLTKIAREEVLTAYETGSPITGREIQASDLNSILESSLSSQDHCDARRRLSIDKSRIVGSIAVGSMAPVAVQDDSPDDGSSAAALPVNRAWLGIPVAITKTSISGGLNVNNVNTSCKIELTGSTFADAVLLRSATIGATFDATGTLFNDGLEAFGVQWNGLVSFHLADFGGNVEFTLLRGARSVVQGDITFEKAIFRHYASFLNTAFAGRTSFRQTQFMMDANFGQSNIGAGPADHPFNGPFYMTEFQGRGLFRRVKFKSLVLYKSIFRNGLEMYGARGDALSFYSAILSGRADFDDSRIDQVRIWGFNGVTEIDGDAQFRRSVMDQLDLKHVLFRKAVHLEDAEINCSFLLSDSSFDADLHLEGAKLLDTENSSCSKVHVTHPFLMQTVNFNGGVYVDQPEWLSSERWWAFWKGEDPRFTVMPDGDKRRFWRESERSFQKAEDISLKNDARYRLKFLEEQSNAGVEWVKSAISRWFWGYGLLPLRVLFWIVAMLVFFALIYWPAMGDESGDSFTVLGLTRRAKRSVAFSCRTAWELWYGYHCSRGTFYSTMTLLESFLGKVLLVLLAYSLTQTSPLLSELAKKLLP
ncbi:hypothetical protein ACCT18_05270 [Rhizobium ruizarguesonis]